MTHVGLQGLLGASRNDKTGEVEYMQFLQQLQEEDQFHRNLREPVSLQDKEYAAFLVQVCVCVLVFTTCMCVDVIHHNLHGTCWADEFKDPHSIMRWTLKQLKFSQDLNE